MSGLVLYVEPKHKDNVIKKRTYFTPQSLVVCMRKIREANKQMQNSSLVEAGAGSKVPSHHWVEEVIRSLRRDKLETEKVQMGSRDILTSSLYRNTLFFLIAYIDSPSLSSLSPYPYPMKETCFVNCSISACRVRPSTNNDSIVLTYSVTIQ